MSLELELKNILLVTKKPVLRFSPCPNGYPTIGHLKGLLILDNLKKKIPGCSLNLRFDDNNPSENLDPLHYTAFNKLIKDYDIEIQNVYYAAQNHSRYLQAVNYLRKNKKAYVCNCILTLDVKNRIFCDCFKNLDLQSLETSKLKENLTVRYFSKTNHNYVIYRSVTDQKNNKNIWSPTIALQGPVDDYYENTTLVVRGRDLESLTKRQEEIYLELYKKSYPPVFYWGRINIWNSETKESYNISKSELSKTNELELPNLKGFYTRGYSFRAIKNWLLSYGFTKNDIKLDIMKLNYYQKKELRDVKSTEIFDKTLPTGYYKSLKDLRNNQISKKNCFYFWNSFDNILTQY